MALPIGSCRRLLSHVTVCLALVRKYCIESERQFDFLRDLVANVSDVAPDEGEGSGTAAPRRRASSYHRSRSNNTGNRTPVSLMPHASLYSLYDMGCKNLVRTVVRF